LADALGDAVFERFSRKAGSPDGLPSELVSLPVVELPPALNKDADAGGMIVVGLALLTAVGVGIGAC